MRLLRELCLKTLLIVLVSCIIGLGNLVIVYAQSQSLDVTIKLAPSTVETGADLHRIGHVGLVDRHGNLVRVPNDTVIRLESENPGIASVPPEITIPVGAQFATFDVTTGISPGTVKIFAQYKDDLDYDVLSVGRYDEILASSLRLIVNLPTSEMNVNSVMPFSLYLQDLGGKTVQAPFDIPISLEYERGLVGVDIFDHTIKKGNSYILGTITSHDKVGNAFIRASADKLGFDEAKEIRISSSLPSSLAIQILPEKIPATLKRDVTIIVSLTDSDGLPTFAQEDIHLQFFSDDQFVNSQIDRIIKEQSITPAIKKGEFSYHFKPKLDLFRPLSGFLAEERTITVGVATRGLGVAMDTFDTVRAITTANPLAENKTIQIYTLDKIPTKSKTVAVFQIGALIPKNVGENVTDTASQDVEFVPLIVNEVYDSVGGDRKISLTSTNDMLLRISEIGNMDVSNSYGTAIIQTGQETGPVVLSSTIKGIGAASTTIEVINTLKQERTLIFSPTGRESILFDRRGHFDLFLISLDSKSRPTAVENEVRYLVTPINEIMTIQRESTYSHVSFPGSAIQSDGQSILIRTVPVGESANTSLQSHGTFRTEPTAKIGISIPFSTLSPDMAVYPATIQVYDFYNNPIALPGDLRVKITPSEFGIIGLPDYVTIPAGESFAAFPIETSGKAGTITLDASARGIIGTTASLETRSTVTKLKIDIGSVMEPLLAGEMTELKIYVDDEDQRSVGGATVKLVSRDASVMPETITTNGEGYAIVQMSPNQSPRMSLQILATANGFTGDQRTYNFDVMAEVEPVAKTELPEWIIYAGIGAVAVVGGGMTVALRKPKKQDEDEIYE